MRLFTFLLLSLLAVPLARATPLIDDLVIVGDGHTIAFALASVLPTGSFIGAAEYETFPTTTSATIDDVGGHDLTVFFYAILDGARHPTSGGIDISIAGLFDYNLSGVPSLIHGYGPTFFGAYLVAGDYTLYKHPPYDNSDSFSLSIKPEASSSPVPEPGTFSFLLTGFFALLLLLRSSFLRYAGLHGREKLTSCS